MRFENQSGIRIFDKTFDKEPLFFKHCTSIHISNCRFINNGELIIRFEDCGTIDIDGCNFMGCLGHFIQSAAMGIIREMRITNNIFIAGRQSYYLDANQKRVDNGASGDVIALRNVHDFCVLNNYLEGGGEFGITVGYGCSDGVIANNTLREMDASGILVGTGASDQIVERIRVFNNIIDTCGRNWQGDSINQSGISCRGCIDCQLIGNRITNSVPTSLIYGIQARDARNLVIQGNFFGTHLENPFRVAKDLRHTVTELQSDVAPKP